MGMRSPIFQPKRLAVFAPDDRALAVFYEVLPLVIGNDQFGDHLALIFGVDHELREEVLFVLIDAAEPIVVGYRLDPGNARNLVAVRQAAGAE